MRHGRAKAARKTLQHFARTIGLKPPYHLLVDTTFVVAMHQHHMLPLDERIEKLLQNYNHYAASTSSSVSTSMQHQNNRHFPTKFFILETALKELNVLVDSLIKKRHHKLDSFQSSLKWIEKYCTVIESTTESRPEDEKDNGDEKNTNDGNDGNDANAATSSTLTPAEAIWEYISGQQQEHSKEKTFTPYLVATQDEELLDKLRHRGTVPIIRLASGSVLLLEQPSKSSKHVANKKELHKWKNSLKTQESELIQVVKQEQRSKRKRQQQLDKEAKGVGVDLYQERKRNKKAKKVSSGGGGGGISQPNPLSCKKKSSEKSSKNKASTESSASKRRKRAQKQNKDNGAEN